MNTSKIGSILATTIIWLVVGLDKDGSIALVMKEKYISKNHCLKVSRSFEKGLYTAKPNSIPISNITSSTCLPFKWDGKDSEGERN